MVRNIFSMINYSEMKRKLMMYFDTLNTQFITSKSRISRISKMVIQSLLSHVSAVTDNFINHWWFELPRENNCLLHCKCTLRLFILLEGKAIKKIDLSWFCTLYVAIALQIWLMYIVIMLSLWYRRLSSLSYMKGQGKRFKCYQAVGKKSCWR